VWQLQAADPEAPYLLPLGAGTNVGTDGDPEQIDPDQFAPTLLEPMEEPRQELFWFLPLIKE